MDRLILYVHKNRYPSIEWDQGIRGISSCLHIYGITQCPALLLHLHMSNPSHSPQPHGITKLSNCSSYTSSSSYCNLLIMFTLPQLYRTRLSSFNNSLSTINASQSSSIQEQYFSSQNDLCTFSLLYRHSSINAEATSEPHLCNDMFGSMHGTHHCVWVHCISTQVFRDSVLTL